MTKSAGRLNDKVVTKSRSDDFDAVDLTKSTSGN